MSDVNRSDWKLSIRIPAARWDRRRLKPCSSWLYLESPYLQHANVLCAAHECADLGIHSADQDAYKTLPSQFTTLLENELNPTEVMLADPYPLKQRSQAGPHREFPLRCGIETNFKVETPQGFQLGNLTLSKMMREAYLGGIYYYMARPYRVGHLQWRSAHLSPKNTGQDHHGTAVSLRDFSRQQVFVGKYHSGPHSLRMLCSRSITGAPFRPSFSLRYLQHTGDSPPPGYAPWNGRPLSGLL